MNYYLAIDEGTSSARAIVFSEAGEILAIGRRNFSLYYPQPGWVEQEAEEIWQAQYEAVQEALRGAGLTPERIAAVGITNQRETVVAWDRKTGRPLHRAIVWQDRRTADRCTALKPHEPALCQKNRSRRRPLLFRHQGRVASQGGWYSTYGGFWQYR